MMHLLRSLYSCDPSAVLKWEAETRATASDTTQEICERLGGARAVLHSYTAFKLLRLLREGRTRYEMEV